MTNDELRDWIKVAKDIGFSPKDYEQDRKCANILITLAERVIEIGESCPKKKEYYFSCPIDIDKEVWKEFKEEHNTRAEGYNQARADMLLWVAGKLGGLEEVIAESSLCHLCLSNVDEGRKEMLDLVNSIRQLFGVKEEEQVTKLSQVVRGVEEKEFDRDSDGIEICFLERHVRDKGYNTLAQSEVVVDREKVAEVVNNAIQSNKVIEIETAKPRISEFMLRTQLITAIATAIESGSIISLKEKDNV